MGLRLLGVKRLCDERVVRMDRERGLCVRKLCEGLCCARGLYARGYVIAIALRGVTHLCAIQDLAVTFTDRPYAVMDGARVLHTRRFCS